MPFESFSHPEEWDLVNSRLKAELNTSSQIRSYINPFLAVNDLLVSLAQLYAHKRSIAWVTGVSPLLENTQPHFVREGYQVQNIKMADMLVAPDQGKALIEGLNKDTLFLVFFKDHALTSEWFEYEKIEELCAAKKIFFILVSHEFDSSFLIQPNSYGVQCVTQGLNLIRLPERTKLSSSVGAFQNIKWNDSWIGELKKNYAPLEAQITAWETSLTQPKWSYSGLRDWNRSLVIFDSVHGQLVAQKLIENGFTDVSSYADCVSGSPKSIRSWIQPGILDETLRGLVSFSFKKENDIPSKELIDAIVLNTQIESQWSF